MTQAKNETLGRVPISAGRVRATQCNVHDGTARVGPLVHQTLGHLRHA